MASSYSPYLGLRLSDAEKLLGKAGTHYRVTVTEPEWKKDRIEGPLRVIQVRKVCSPEDDSEASGIELVCCPVSDPFASSETNQK